MKSLTDYGYSDMDNGTKVFHFLQGIKSPELEATENDVCIQPRRYGTDFDDTMSYLGQTVTEMGLIMQSVCIVKNGNKLVMPKVAAFIRK